ncbi:unnamed protein product (macronuclear) [Paramecium tetraurelia]|uniref:Transposase IS30-like HTH domain-containing protein n=1 Tax=Paramecium tetraurelia TaxID=5888 RepID=A0C0F9_PARTE|nr:uncharacterized protein GSPATT00006129001 [Paramecium tetraurelia]CAK64276.1 unnamed protein product [Paramecium tetraurelia]|eukprot:XP_001431674.1 hypothetical protein (macronuclear) [Paramecium tetraurelia strain d4-2]
MKRNSYQRITQKSKIRQEIINYRNQGLSNKEISRIMSQKTNKKISEKTIQSIKTVKRKSKYAEYRQITKSTILSYILEYNNHFIYSTDQTQMRKEVSELVKDKFPQPFSHFSQRTHQRLLNGIIKKVESIRNYKSSKLPQNDSEFNYIFYDTQSEEQQIQSASQFLFFQESYPSFQEEQQYF